jgi:hypothetical protein
MTRSWRPIAVLLSVTGLLAFLLVTQAQSAPQTADGRSGIAQPYGACTGGGEGLGASTAGCVNPEGDFFSTCDGVPTPADDTCADLIFPRGPGGFTRLTEEKRGILVCRLNPLCLGSDVNVLIPPGYNNPRKPVVLRIYYDESEVILGKPRTLKQLPSGLTLLLPPCLLPPTVLPCQARVDPVQPPADKAAIGPFGSDIRITILLTSSDPKFQGIIR